MIVLAVLLAAAFIGGAYVYIYSSMSKSREGRLEFYDALSQQNVPTINSPFFGRAKELKELKELKFYSHYQYQWSTCFWKIQTGKSIGS